MTIPMKNILAIILASLAVCCDSQSDNNLGGSSSWAKLQISPDTLSSMKYGNFLVEIYEHANNHKATTTASEKKYYYPPIALLDNKSAVSRLNRVTKQLEMRFRVEMWNDKVENEVVKYLNEIVGHQIKSNQVRVIPLEKVILTSNTPSADYSLSPVWTNYDKSKTLRLSLSCYDQKICDELANEMRSDPTQFDHFKLLYSLSSQTSQTKQTTISIDSVTSGQMVSTLLQKFGDKKEIFLTANDEKKMLTETATKIRMDTFDDSEVGSPDTEIAIYSFLKDLLVASRTTIKEQSDKMWDSVFWNEENYRPDKTTKTLNEILNKLDRETQKILADMFQKVEKQSVILGKLTSSKKDAEKRREEQIRRENQSKDANEKEIKIENEKSEHAKTNSEEYVRNLENKERIQHNYDSKSWADVDRISSTISGKMAKDSDRSRRVEISKEEMAKLLQEGRDNVQWDREKFVPKPMQLSRINLGKFRDSQSFQDRNIRVRYTTAELSAPMKFLEHAELTVTDEWNNFKDELKVNLNQLRQDLKVAEEKLKRDLRATSNDLEITKTNLASTRTELNSTKSAVADLVTKLDARTNEIVDNRTSELVDIGRMPTSCEDLQRMGQKVNGFFLVKGSKKMEMIYCNFNANQNDKQKFIGYVDVKSAPVYFYVQRNDSFSSGGTPIPFDLARVNEGNAMNLTSGIFTAPQPGIYFFSFAGLAYLKSSSAAGFLSSLNLNGNHIGASGVTEFNTPVDRLSPFTLQSTLKLEKGDQVWVQIWYDGSSSSLHDYPGVHSTHFTGFMLEEEIAAAL